MRLWSVRETIGTGLVVAVLLVIVLALPSTAQTQVTANQGAPGRLGAWPVTLTTFPDGGIPVVIQAPDDGLPVMVQTPDGGLPVALPFSCAVPSIKNTVIGTGSVPCPTTRTTGTNWLRICNDRSNGASAVLKIRFDGATVSLASGTPGLTLGWGDCHDDYFPASVVPTCIASTASTNVYSMECIRQ
jgi:hypothetical protein